jgi:hypothetical protein
MAIKGGNQRVPHDVDTRPTKGFTLSRHLPHFRSAKFSLIAIGGALCIAAAASTIAVTWPSSSAAQQAAGLAAATSHTARTVGAADDSQAATMAAVQRVRFGLAARVEAIKLAEARAAAARARALAAREHAAHVAHRKHQTQLAAAVMPQAARQQPSQQQTQQPVSAASGSPQQIAEGMLGQFGWSGQFSCLDSLWNVESGWNPTAENPNSGAYGIPQALPGSKMASAGPDWQTDAATQILWGLQYIQSTYGSPCAAWSHEEATGWY